MLGLITDVIRITIESSCYHSSFSSRRSTPRKRKVEALLGDTVHTGDAVALYLAAPATLTSAGLVEARKKCSRMRVRRILL